MDSRGIVWNIKSRRESGIGSEWQSRDDVDERRRWRGYIKYTTRLREEKLYFLFHPANFGNFIETTIQATGNYYCCWGRRYYYGGQSGKLAFEWNPRTRRRASDSDGQAVLITVWATEKGPRPSTKIVAPSSSSPSLRLAARRWKARVSWLVIDGSRPNARP